MANTWIGPTFENNKIKYSYTADQAQNSGYTIKLATENTFVDQDIWVKVVIPSGTLSAGEGSVSFNNNNATGLFGTVSNTAPSSGNYITVSGSGTVNVSAAGWLAATGTGTPTSSNTATKYYPIISATFAFGTGANANKLYCTKSGYVAANSTTALDSITVQTPTTSYSHSNTMENYFNAGSASDYNVIITPQYSNSAGYVAAHSNTNNGGTGYWKIKTASITYTTTSITGSSDNYTVTRGVAEIVTDGWITATTLDTANFLNQPATGTTESNYVDISDTSAAPILVTGDYLYITKGYTDNVKISLSKLVPDADQITNGKTFASANYILTGYSAWDIEGKEIVGTMPVSTLPTSVSANASSGYTAKLTIYATTSHQYLNIPAGYHSVNSYYTINKLTSSNYSAANIKNGVTISVNNGNTNVYSVTGTFTKANTATATNGAVTYDSNKISNKILSGYSAWVDGYEITGSIATKTSSNLSFDGSTRTFTAPAGYYASNATKQIAAASLTAGAGNVSLTYDTATLSIYKSSSNTGGITINDNAPAADSGKVYIKVTGSGSVSNTVGWLNTATSTSSNNKVRYVILTKYDGTYTTG